MIKSSLFLDQCKSAGYTLFTGTPCSYLKPFINYVIDDNELEFIETTNEGDAVALASGAWLGGRKSIVMFQNSGFGNAVNPITSLSYTSKIPFIGIVTHRGEPGGASDEPQHELMGQITTELLDLMQVPWAHFPTEEDKVQEAFSKAEKSCEETSRPFFFVMRKASVEAYALKSVNTNRELNHYSTVIERTNKGEINATRTQALRSIKNYFDGESAIVATTGKTGRELFEVEDSANQIYMVGSMGCALAIGLGITKSDFKGSTCVIDGDGALLMRLGNMALAGQMGAQKITHVVLDNGVHDSTGGQQSFSESIDFSVIAKGCGYEVIYDVDTIEEFEIALKACKESEQLGFIRFIIKPGSPKDLGRPTVTPSEVAHRMRKTLIG